MISVKNTSENPESIESIINFLDSHPNSNIFQNNTLQGVYSRSKKHNPFSYTFTSNSRIVACLNGVIERNYFWPFNNLTSRAIIIGGPLVLNNDLSLLNKLLEEYTKKIGRKVIYTQFRNVRKFSKEEIDTFKKQGYIYEEHLSIIHDLSIPITDQWMKLHKGRRKNIRRAERNGLVFREINTTPEFEESFELVQDTYKRLRLPFPDKSLFSEMKKAFMDNGIFRTFIATRNDKTIATRMVLCYKGLIYDWYAGASSDHLYLYPNDYLPWKILEWGTKNGFKYFDFGGAGKPNIPYGVRDHKLKFGGELVEFGRFVKVHKPIFMRMGKIGISMKKMI